MEESKSLADGARTPAPTLVGRVALVTGASRGIGRGVAQVLVREGARVVINHWQDATAAEQLRAALGAERCHVVEADVRDPSTAAALVEASVAAFGRLDILVNNAGICPFAPFEEVTPQTWANTLATNLTGPFFVSQAAARVMRGQGEGSIVNIASVAVRLAQPTQVHYATTKGGLLAFTHVLAAALGPYGIRVNALLVGGVPTDINRSQYTPDFVEGLRRRLPLRRMGTPQDVGEAVAFLASPRASWITGAALAVDGGRLVAP